MIVLRYSKCDEFSENIDVLEMIDHYNEGNVTNKQMANKMLTRIVDCLKYLSGQNIALRGTTGDSSNFVQLLKFLSTQDEELASWLKRTHSYTSPENQNELLKLMASDVTRRILDRVKEQKYYTIMLDETSDSSNHEQLVICLR